MKILKFSTELNVGQGGGGDGTNELAKLSSNDFFAANNESRGKICGRELKLKQI